MASGEVQPQSRVQTMLDLSSSLRPHSFIIRHIHAGEGPESQSKHPHQRQPLHDLPAVIAVEVVVATSRPCQEHNLVGLTSLLQRQVIGFCFHVTTCSALFEANKQCTLHPTISPPASLAKESPRGGRQHRWLRCRPGAAAASGVWYFCSKC